MPGGCCQCCGTCMECCCWCCIPLNKNTREKDSGWVDLEEVIKDVAWDKLKEFPVPGLSKVERRCALSRVLTLEVDRSSIRVTAEKDERGTLDLASQGVARAVALPTPGDKGPVHVLFQSTFKNTTENAQTYSFKTERRTTSFVELSLHRGFTIGSSLDVEMTAPVPTGIEGPKGKLGCNMQWSFRRGEVTRKEETVAWCVDNTVIVKEEHVGTATLSIKECATTSDFTLKCAIRALDRTSPDADRDQKTAQDQVTEQGQGEPTAPTRKSGWLGRVIGRVSCATGGESQEEEHNIMINDDKDKDENGMMAQDEGNKSAADGKENKTGKDRKTTEMLEPDEHSDKDEGGIEEIIEQEVSQSLTQEKTGRRKQPPPMKTEPKVAVLVRHKATSRKLKTLRIRLPDIHAKCQDHFYLSRAGAAGSGVIYCDIKGHSHAVYAIEQIVELKDCKFSQQSDKNVPSTSGTSPPKDQR